MRTLLLSLLLISAPLVHATDSSSDQRGAVQANFDDFQANYNSLVFSLSGYIASWKTTKQMCMQATNCAAMASKW